MSLKQEVVEAEQTKMRKRVFRMVQSLYTLFRGSATDLQIIDQYMKMWRPVRAKNTEGKNQVIVDVLLWPYEGRKNNPRLSKKNNPRCCLYCLVTECLKAYHQYCEDAETFEGDLDAMLTEIEGLITAKLEVPIVGTDATGYYFKKKVSGPPRRNR
jgi:hypothetical protein